VETTGTELLKRGGTALQERVQKLIIQIWNKNKCLKIGVWDLFFHHFKKDDKTKCLKCRGIMLLNVAHKIFFTILASKLSPFPEEIPGEYQCGFCPGRSSTEQIFILRQSMGKWRH
jgi:hypothetical protein